MGDCAFRVKHSPILLPLNSFSVHDPTQVSFTAKKTFCNISVEGVESVLDGSPIKYAAQALLATEEYVVE